MRISVFIIAVVFVATLGAFPQHGRAGIIGSTDDRGSLIKLGPKLGLSAAEIEQARRSTGYINCPLPKEKKIITGSAALVLSNQTIVTAAHIFIDKKHRWREPLSDCYFRPQAAPFTKIKIDPTSIATGPLTPGRRRQGINDWAVVRLVSPVRGATPYEPLPRVASVLRMFTRIVSIAASAKGFKSDLDIPLIQECEVRMTSLAEESRSFLSDCDTSPGMSGSIILVRRDGQLFAAAMTRAATEGNAYAEFDASTGSDRAVTHHLEIREDFYRALTNMARCGKAACD